MLQFIRIRIRKEIALVAMRTLIRSDAVKFAVFNRHIVQVGDTNVDRLKLSTMVQFHRMMVHLKGSCEMLRVLNRNAF